MAIFHLTVKPITRSVGRSATAAAAYRSGERIADRRTGEIHDYRRKNGIVSTDIVLPKGSTKWAFDRAKLWNAAELTERRKDACVAREYEVALPAELSGEERRQLVLKFAQDMADVEGCGVDVAIHGPGRGGDNRNHHAHILRTTRKIGTDGLGEKLASEKAGRKRKEDLDGVRARWAAFTNDALARAGHTDKVDHRSLVAQGIDREPSKHLGPILTAIYRRGGQSYIHERRATESLEIAALFGKLERTVAAVEKEIIILETDITAALAQRDAQQRVPSTLEELRTRSRSTQRKPFAFAQPDHWQHQFVHKKSEIFNP